MTANIKRSNSGADVRDDHAPVHSTFTLASDTFLFLHAGGMPIPALSRQLSALRCFGQPDAHFDLEGLLWTAMQSGKANSFTAYVSSLVDRTTVAGGIMSALIDYRDLLWLEQRAIFQEQLQQRLRIVRLAFLDPALQAYRRLMAKQDLRRALRHERDRPGFPDLARELIHIEEDEHRGDAFCQGFGVPMVKVWLEDLARPGVPALRGLLDRWSIQLEDGAVLEPIDPPSRSELEAVAVFRQEASQRHWSHALRPNLP